MQFGFDELLSSQSSSFAIAFFILLRFCYDYVMIFQPQILISANLEALLWQASLLRQTVLLTPINPQIELEWRFQSSIEATHYSTAIEGNPLTLEEVRKLLSNQPILKPRNREIEVRNYKHALDWIRHEWSGHNKPLDSQTIIELHHMIMRDLDLPARLGKWRTDPVFVFDTRTQEPVHEGDPAKDIAQRIAAMCQWNQQSSLHPAIRAAIIHLEFVRIHPFMDGNGRTARLLETLVLAQHAWDARGLIALEPYYKNHLFQYYEKIQTSLKHQDWAAWIYFVVTGLLEQLQNLKQRLQTKEHQTLPEIPLLNERQWRILALLEPTNALISNADIQRLTSASHMTAARDLTYLVQLGLLEKHGAGRATKYKRKR